ncbi:transcription termination factor MTERF8, chloroplastic isoform X1 [Arachis duranensis]|uniref:Transcription termination factor MTERF8, chloroplastic isoform X1 n=1 Tax=Arachis duranensis TaxID=130453 RepID=A0A6P4B9U1_ARADU|nr:transcription termination factor MTERF8, chloroplastic isoform X1 [Arachis duranensis]
MRGSYNKNLFLYHLTVITRTSSPSFLIPSPSSIFRAPNYATVTETLENQSFTVNYLVNNCGFLPDSALHASKYVLFKTPEKPDSVIALFRSFGFSDLQIHNVIRKKPRILVSKPKETILPKLEFLTSKGASKLQLARIIDLNPLILKRSLEKHLIPAFDLLNNFIRSEERTVASILRAGQILTCSRSLRNINMLVDLGVRKISMARLIRQWPWLLLCNSEVRLKSIVDEVIKMGVDPSKANFVPALYATYLPKSMWDKKVELFKRFGLTDDNILEAFVKHSCCMLISVQKTEACIEFFVKELGWKPVDVTNYPVLLSLNLEKRLVPRAAVLKILMANGAINSGKHLLAYTASEERFFKKYVNRGKDQAPELLKLYREKMNLPVMDSKLMS